MIIKKSPMARRHLKPARQKPPPRRRWKPLRIEAQKYVTKTVINYKMMKSFSRFGSDLIVKKEYREY